MRKLILHWHKKPCLQETPLLPPKGKLLRSIRAKNPDVEFADSIFRDALLPSLCLTMRERGLRILSLASGIREYLYTNGAGVVGKIHSPPACQEGELFH